MILERHDPGRLTIYDPRVVAVSSKMRWKPKTAIRRIESALPSIPERTIYLAIGGDFGLRPESFAKLLKIYLGANRMKADELQPSTRRFLSLLEFIAAVLDLLKVQALDYPGLSLSIDNAAQIVLTYGNENYDHFFAMLEANLPQLRSRCGLGENATYSNAMNRAVWYVLKFVIPINRAAGIPDLLSLEDVGGRSRDRQRNETTSDELQSLDYDSLKQTEAGRRLSELGIDL